MNEGLIFPMFSTPLNLIFKQFNLDWYVCFIVPSYQQLNLARRVLNAPVPNVLIDCRVDPHFLLFRYLEMANNLSTDDLDCSG